MSFLTIWNLLTGRKNIDRIDIGKKVGVDPLGHKALKMTSDSFFETNKENFDIIFIDGHHESNQVYRDIINALDVLNDNGTIVVHDLLPTDEIMSLVPRTVSKWTGDCYKAWIKLRQERSDLTMCVVDIDWGVGIIQRGEQELLGEVEYSYAYFSDNRNKLMNVIGVDDFLKWIGA